MLMKQYTYEEIKKLHLQIGSESWTASRMCGRCGISDKRLKEAKKIRPDIPTDVIKFPKEFVVKAKQLKKAKK